MKTDDMDLAGDVVQAMATFLNLDDLQTTIDFPDEMEMLRQVLIKVNIVLVNETLKLSQECVFMTPESEIRGHLVFGLFVTKL